MMNLLNFFKKKFKIKFQEYNNGRYFSLAFMY